MTMSGNIVARVCSLFFSRCSLLQCQLTTISRGQVPRAENDRSSSSTNAPTCCETPVFQRIRFREDSDLKLSLSPTKSPVSDYNDLPLTGSRILGNKSPVADPDRNT